MAQLHTMFFHVRNSAIWREFVQMCKVYRVTTFVPPDRVESLLEGIVSHVGLEYGNYDRAAWWSAIGVEQFRPLPGARPTFGVIGKVERVPTVRMEFVIPHDRKVLNHFLTKGLLPNHPWQEPAVFIDASEITITHAQRVELDQFPSGRLVPSPNPNSIEADQ